MLASRMFDYPYPRIVMRGVARNLSYTSAFLPDSSTGLPVSYAISHSPFSLLPGRYLGFARDDGSGTSPHPLFFSAKVQIGVEEHGIDVCRAFVFPLVKGVPMIDEPGKGDEGSF